MEMLTEIRAAETRDAVVARLRAAGRISGIRSLLTHYGQRHQCASQREQSFKVLLVQIVYRCLTPLLYIPKSTMRRGKFGQFHAMPERFSRRLSAKHYLPAFQGADTTGLIEKRSRCSGAKTSFASM